MLPRYKALLALAMVFALVIATPAARADDDDVVSHARIVRLSYAEGTVQLNGENATMNVPITEGSQLVTGSDGRAEVQLEDGSVIRLASETDIIFSRLGRVASGSAVTAVDLNGGEAEFKITARDGSDFSVNVRNRTILLRKAGRFRVIAINSDPLELAVWKGEMAIHDPDSGQDIAVQKNETFTLNPQDLQQYALDPGIQADDLDQWSDQRDEYLSTYASGNYAQSPYQYGLNDLNNYGQYYDIPGYGYMWQPNGVGISWDPFANGYWAYTPGFGYCWISAYPWGWMPYRWGHWVFVNGYGWLWQPGGWSGWRTRPRLLNAPPGFHPPTPPTMVAGHPSTPIRTGRPLGTIPPVGGNNPDRLHKRVFTNEDVENKQPPSGQPGVELQPGGQSGGVAGGRAPVITRRQIQQNNQNNQQPNTGRFATGVHPPVMTRTETAEPVRRTSSASPSPTAPTHSSGPPPAPARTYSAPAPAPAPHYSAPVVVHSSPPPSSSVSTGRPK